MTLEEYRKYLNKYLKDFISILKLAPAVGRKYYCINPKHHDINPSMAFYEDPTPHFYCHGCNTLFDIVDVYKILVLKKGVDEPTDVRDALMNIAKMLREHGINVKDFVDERKLYYAARKIHSFITKLPLGKAQREFLKSKGIDPEKAKGFGVGWIASQEKYLKFLNNLAREIGEDAIESAGFRNKLLFRENNVIYTIFDLENRPVAFAARVLDYSKINSAKYLNTRSSAIYSKKDIGYGMNWAKGKKNVYIVEGYNDALAFYVRDVFNVVAVASANPTAELLTNLKSSGSEGVVFALDPDDAGIDGVMRIVTTILPSIGLYASVKVLDGRDPDEILRDEGLSGFYKQETLSVPAFVYRVSKNLTSALRMLTTIPILNYDAVIDDLVRVACENGEDITADKIKLYILKKHVASELSKIKNKLMELREVERRLENLSGMVEKLLQKGELPHD